MLLVFYNQEVDIVASYTLAWIEIGTPDLSAPIAIVASYTLAWIEIYNSGREAAQRYRRKLHACVD